MDTWGHIGWSIFGISFPLNRWSLHLSSCLVAFCAQYQATMTALSVQVFNGCPEMLLVSLLPHYNPLCVLCEWLMMIMQMFHRRAAWVIITAENEAFWNSLTAEEKTMGLQCVCVWVYSIFISLCKLGALRLWPPNLWRVLWDALWAFYPP